MWAYGFGYNGVAPDRLAVPGGAGPPFVQRRFWTTWYRSCFQLPKGSVADVGAGTGQITARLLARGCQVDAYEPTPAMLALLRERLAGNADGIWRIFDQGIDGLACGPGSYDTMCCVNVLDHIKDLGTALHTLTDALRRGGTLVVSIPHPLKGSWWVEEDPTGRQLVLPELRR
ncbi:MAG: class I SAM-dependent methyltransferase, partial [Pseudonocardiaceae bacterium]